jgi:hypothetical protein
MTRTSRSLSTLVLALVAAPAVLVAQGTTTSALTGLVRDPAGKPLAGALVRIASSAMIGGEKSVRTSENGSYRFPMLVPGLYKITVASQGHSSLSGLEILELGQTSTVNWKFQPVASATVEVVSGAGIGMETATTGVSQNFASETIASLPATRTLSDILNMTPGINGSNAWGGSGSGSNAYLMDGINVGDTSGGTQWIYANMDWFDEVQVGGLGAAAEFGGFSGGFINTVVKRGGNALSGVFSSFYDSTKWQAKSSNKDWNWTQADREVPDAKNYDIRMSVGGPILKDKLWYFLSAQKEQNEMTYTGTLPTGPLPTKKINSLRVLGKLTYQVLPTATLEGMFEYDNRNIDHKYVNQTWGLYDAAAGGEQTSPSRYYSLTWTQTLGANLVLTLKGNGYNGGYDILPTHGDVNCLDIDADKFFNNLDIAERNKRGRTSFSATLDYFKSGLFSASDNHAFRIGLEREKGFSESVTSNPGGYVLTADTGDVVGGVQEYLPYGAYTIGVEDVKVHSNKTILFAQDT